MKDFKTPFRHSLTLFVCKQVTGLRGMLAYLSIYCWYNESRDFEKWFPTVYPFYITAELLLKQKQQQQKYFPTYFLLTQVCIKLSVHSFAQVCMNCTGCCAFTNTITAMQTHFAAQNQCYHSRDQILPHPVLMTIAKQTQGGRNNPSWTGSAGKYDITPQNWRMNHECGSHQLENECHMAWVCEKSSFYHSGSHFEEL